MKVFELLIDPEDELSGIQYISIVKSPANEFAFEVFNNQEPHTCRVEHDFSDEDLKVLENFGEPLNPILLEGARIKPAELVFTKEDFAAPSITSNPKAFDIKSGDQQGGNVITRYIYGVDTGMGAPLIRTSREMCRKMLAAQRVFSRQDIINLSSQLTSASDTFKLVPRAKMNPSVDAFEYKMGALCRHRWFQIEFDVPQGMTYDQALGQIPVKAQAALGKGQARNVGGTGRPFTAEAKWVPVDSLNRRPAGFSKDTSLEPVGFHFGLFMYPTRFAALVAEPSAQALTKVKIKACGYGYGCEGYVPIEVMPEYFEETAEVEEVFRVRHSFVEVPKYIQDAAQRAVDYAEENGWGDCGTDVGKQRAHDLARAGEEHSLETLTRMYSYGARHKVDYESSKSIDEGCGYLMLLSWGFTPETFDSVMKFLEGQIDKATQMNIQFSQDEFRQDITAVVFQPNQYIYRYDRYTKSPYWVFMSKETIRTALMKLSRLKPKNLINLEHSDKVFSGDEVYSYENWLVGDEPKKDKSYEIFGREFAPGTWITTIHFRSKELFEKFILSNSTSGISLEGLFEEVPFNFFKETDFDFPPDTCWEGYEPYGTKIKDGVEVPNCVPIRTSKVQMDMEMDIFGYKTQYFFICPGAQELFQKLVLLNPPVDEQGMIRSMALQADKVFQIEYEAMKRGTATTDDLLQASILVDDFKDLTMEVDKLLMTNSDVSFMDGHLEIISSLIESFARYPWNECIADMTERYGADAAPKICGKIRAENMGLQGIDGGVPTFDLQEEAEKMALEIGCQGSHQMPTGWSPCRTHQEGSEAWDAYTRVFLLEELIKRIME
jgi:hypothetical protein